MKSLDLIRKFLRLFGILDRGPSKREKILGIVTNCVVFMVHIVYLTTTFWFFAFKAQTLFEYSESFFYMLCGILLLIWYPIYLWQRTKYHDLINDLAAIIEKRSENPVAKTIYKKTNDTIVSLIVKGHFITFNIEFPFYITSSILLSMYQYVSSDYSTDSFQLMYPASFPFDWKTPAGYLASVAIQTVIVFFSTEMFFITFISIIGLCLLVTEFVSDLKQDIHQLNSHLIGRKDKIFSAAERIEIKKKLIGIIQFHSDAKEFANRFSDVNSAIILVYLLFVVISYCSMLIQINRLIITGDADVFRSVLPAYITLLLLFLFCYFGHRMTQRFDDVADELYKLAWYKLPLDEQKKLQMMIALGQKSVYLRGYGGIPCTHEVFMKIVKASFSYFMVIREFDA